ncbi:gluconate 5-dehydrogenase [Steroidobacter denitrificans]|uniref:Gluconate 5-dehydrogenase n=1 Tax=Steroidobacter denitrificans TaxID=465721 RepID=A0A127FDP0_STEDE|nr:glucose 1-dehydrogenase [Steroidobacter denitrificans]AMN47755.1 gluconate 5-dehydrogenase [Steroidobacter denitrificans]
MNLFSLSGRVALVTGASRGLGKAMAQALARAGATVVLTARDAARLEEVADELRREGHQAHVDAFDLLDEEAVVTAVPRIVERFGRLDILLNNAGMYITSKLLDSTLELWRRTLDTNLTAAYLLAREAARVMIPRQSGRIINVGSYCSVLGRERMQAYAASKHGIAGLTKSLAGELGRYGITCNAIAPGYFMTDMIERVADDTPLMQAFVNAIALDRFGRPEEICGAAIFLASDAASYVTGHILNVDGGVANVVSIRPSRNPA